MIRGYIKNGYGREALFSEGMEHKDVLKCTARFGLNEVDSADLTLPSSNRPARSLLTKNAVIELQNDGEVVFIGEVAAVPRNELGDISFELDGALGFLSGVCKAPFTIKPSDPNGPVENFLTAIFNQYNAAVPTERRLQLGAVTVAGGVSMDHSDEYVSMLDLVREVREKLGGFLYVDYTSGMPTVHYVATPTARAARPLVLGENVLTVDDRLDFTSYASRVYATGSYYVTTGGKREKKPLNAGYVVDTDAEAVYGRKDLAFKSDTDMGGDEDAGIPDKTQQEATAIILAEAQMILDERKVPLRSLEMTATELARMGVDHRQYKVGTVAPAHVQILGIDTELIVRSVCPDYIDQGNSTVSFGRQAATISGASLGGGGSVSGGGSGGSSGSGQVGPPGPAGPAGADGYSPVVTVEAITGGHRVTIEDRTGEHVFDVMDGDSTSAPVRSVNGKTGVVVLSASDVGAMPAGTYIPVKISDLTDDSNFISHGNGVIAKNELVSTVQASLDKADAAVLFTPNQGLNSSQQGHARANIGAGTSTVTYQNNQLIIQNPGEAYKVIDLSSADVFAITIQKTPTASTASKTFTQIRDAVIDGKIIEFNFEDSTTGESYYSYGFCVKNGTNNVMELEVKFCREVTGSAAHYFIATFYGNDTFALNEVTHAGGGGSGSGNFVKITYNSNTTAVTHNGTAITGAQIKALLDQQDAGAIMVDTNGNPNGVYRLKNIYANGDVEFEGELGDVVMNVIVPAASSTGNATVTRKAQVYYYLDGTTVKSAVTNYAVTGQQIQNATIDNGLAPIIYKYESSNYITYEYHYFAMHSGGMIFRTLDGKRQIFLGWDSSTATITQAAGWAANILFYLDGTTVKYSGTNTAVTGSDIQAITVAVGIMPVIRQTINGIDYYFYFRIAHSGGLEFRLLDGTKDLSLRYDSSTATVTINYYAVTLNADGTVNTFDSALTYSAAAASVINGNPKKLIVKWGNSIFTADANEKLSGANGDVKFITDVEHDGIQRHMIFTLTSANALQTTLIETYARVPSVVWEVADVTQGLIALNTNISSSLAWQLTGLNLAPFKRIKVYVKAGRKTGIGAADSSITPASIIEMSLDDRAKETVSQNVFIGSSVVQNPNDPNRLGVITCAVSGDKTKFAVVRATTLYGTAATSNTDAYPYVFKIEGYYD